MPRKRIKSTKTLSLPRLPIEDFEELYYLMYVVFGSHRKASYALQVSYTTYRSWNKNPPDWPYYPLVMHALIKAKLKTFQFQRKSYTRQRQYELEQRLGQIKNLWQLTEPIELEHSAYTDADHWLRIHLTPNGMYWDRLKTPRYNGGHSHRTLQQSAKRIGVIKEVTGFGPSKRSFWRLPTLEDLEQRISTAKQGDIDEPEPLTAKHPPRRRRREDS